MLMVEGASVANIRRIRVLVLAFFALSVVASLAVVSVRNTYDDEFSSLELVRKPFTQVWTTANSGDVHPPGMYELAHFAYEATPSPRWMTVWAVLLLEACLAFYMLRVAPLLPTTKARVCFLLLSCLHPQLLMWGITIRWYGWWTGPALLTTLVALQPTVQKVRPDFSYGRAASLALLLAALFYVNYITLIFAVALGLTMLFRYGVGNWRPYLLAAGLAFLLILPQLHPMLSVHIPGGQGQRSGVVLSFGRLFQSVVMSEAYLPWHPLALAALLIFCALIVAGATRLVRLCRQGSFLEALSIRPGLGSLTLFALLLFACLGLTGFGVKPRSSLLLLPLLAVPFSLSLADLRSLRVQTGILLLLALWAGIGVTHLLRRESLLKASMINHPEEVQRYVLAQQGADCSVVITYDSLLAFTFENSAARHVLILSPWRSPLPAKLQPFDTQSCAALDVYRVRSYLGGMGEAGETDDRELSSLAPSLLGSGQMHSFGHDADAPLKRRFAFATGASNLPDYRYVVAVNHVPVSELPAIEAHLPHYFAAPDGTAR